MTKLALLVAICLPSAACIVGSNDPVSGGQGSGDDGTGSDGSGSSDPGTPGATTKSGTISANESWNTAIDVTGALTIAAGVTVTVAPGTTIHIASGGSITVNGMFDASGGTKAAPIVIAPVTAGAFHLGVRLPTGGALKYSYVTQTGGGISTSGGSATIVDSLLSGASGDFLVMNGGAVDVSYSQIGKDAGVTDTTHCDMHFDGAMPNTIKVTHSNISTTSYGLMFYHGTAADFTYNNWFGNTTDVDTNAGVVGDFSNGWFEKTPPAATGNGGAQLTLGTLAVAKLTDAGPR
ncbi:MAG TPA: hypothetical protein VGM90_17195 [Kofleriaceae bacterium]